MKDKYGVFDLGMDEAQNRLISPEYTMEALRRLADVFDDHDAQPQIYAVKNIATGVIIGKVRRNVAALKVQRDSAIMNVYSSIARRFLARAPDPVAVLRGYVRQFGPIWPGAELAIEW